ncbi:MAG: PEP-CTERM sorting domain-containing protein [Planctomycetota bacterium]
MRIFTPFYICVFAWIFHPVSATTIVDSALDWDLAINDGLDQNGAAVTPGSAADSAQPGHPDSSGSGTWRYGFGNRGDGLSFGGTFANFSIWNGFAWTAGGSSLVGRTFQAPAGGSTTANPMSYREWTSNGSYTGQTLYGTLIYQQTTASGVTDGLTIRFNHSSDDVADFSQLINPVDIGTEFMHTFSFVDEPGTKILVGTRPEGTGVNDANNFFNDRSSVQLLISTVPEPSTAMMIAVAGFAVGCRRRSNR